MNDKLRRQKAMTDHADKLAEGAGEGFDSDAAKAHADGSRGMPEGPTALEIAMEQINDHYRHSFSESEYDLLIEIAKYALPRLPESDQRHIAELLQEARG